MDYSPQPPQHPQQQQYMDQSAMHPFPQDMPFAYPNPMYNPWSMLYGNPMSGIAPPTAPRAEWRQTLLCNKIYAPMIANPQTRGQTIDAVSGRLCLLSGSKKYTVTVGEVCRRISAPETLHASLINGILRNGKAKDNGTKLRAKLMNYNVQLPQGRRKTCQPTGFTALCEGESIEMAKDLGILIARDGGANDIGKYLREVEIQQSREFMEDMKIFKKWLQMIIEFHPDTANCDDICPKNGPEHCVNHLSLLTHGFSHIAIPIILRFAMLILDNVHSPRDEERLAGQEEPDEEILLPVPRDQENAMAMNMNMMMPREMAPPPFSDATNQPPGFPGFNPYQFGMFPQWPQQQMGFNGGQYMPPFGHTASHMLQNYSDKTYIPLLPSLKDRVTKFDEVSGRLLLLSQSHKYVVTTGEVCRRMAAPETLHTSMINGILRNAKAKDNGTLLRSKLQNYNIELPQGRRKTCQLTKFTCLCEAEAHGLAKDFQRLLDIEETGGADEIGRYLGEREASEGRNVLATEGPIVRNWLHRIMNVHMCSSEPESMKPKNNAERAVHHLSLITHGFSHVAITAVLNYANRIMETATKANANPETSTPITANLPHDMPPLPGMTPIMHPITAPFFPPLPPTN